MCKYSYELKVEVVKYYLENKYGYGLTAKYFNIKSATTVKNWIKKYKKHGLEGLTKNKKASYDGKFKENVIKYMNDNHLSLQETAYHFNLANATIVSKWERIYYKEGEKALYNNLKGQSKHMGSKLQKNKLSDNTKEDLIAENERLRMENEYLKKLNALVQERVNQEKKKK